MTGEPLQRFGILLMLFGGFFELSGTLEILMPSVMVVALLIGGYGAYVELTTSLIDGR